MKVKKSKNQKPKKQISNSFNVPSPLISKEESCGPPVAKTYLDNSNGLHHSSNSYNKVKFFSSKLSISSRNLFIKTEISRCLLEEIV